MRPVPSEDGLLTPSPPSPPADDVPGPLLAIFRRWFHSTEETSLHEPAACLAPGCRPNVRAASKLGWRKSHPRGGRETASGYPHSGHVTPASERIRGVNVLVRCRAGQNWTRTASSSNGGGNSAEPSEEAPLPRAGQSPRRIRGSSRLAVCPK